MFRYEFLSKVGIRSSDQRGEGIDKIFKLFTGQLKELPTAVILKIPADFRDDQKI